MSDVLKSSVVDPRGEKVLLELAAQDLSHFISHGSG